MMLKSTKGLSARRRMMAGAGCGAMLMALVPLTALAQSEVVSFNIRSAPLSQGLLEFGRQAGISVAADQSLTQGLRSAPVSGDLPVDDALDRLLSGTGLRAEFVGRGTVRLVRAGQGDAGGTDISGNGQSETVQATTIDDIIVTAQKREESIQDVPIAVSAFSAETLDAMKIEGGSELLRAIPNVTFSKANFSMYNFAIRGIGTKAISSSSDPAVAVSFNNSPMLRNRLFEAEYLDVNRVEVLRGPQGTLYGRNATAGVVNMIPNLPKPDFDAMLKAEVGNYGTVRGQMMLNLPLSDTFWLRGAASTTKRDGFDLNTFKDQRVNGRDLYTARISAAWEPIDSLSANLIWERFGEDDNRSRTGKQLCTTDPGPTQIGNFQITDVGLRGKLSQGCLPKTLYSAAAYGAPNASGMAQLQIMSQGGIGLGGDRNTFVGQQIVLVMNQGVNPYDGVVQSQNLREISTSYDPKFRAVNDVIQFNVSIDIADGLKLSSQTLYTKDSYYSTQDYARYVSNEIFNDSSKVYAQTGRLPFPLLTGSEITPGRVYTDPQLGPSTRMVSADLSTSKSDQLYQEIRIHSSFDGNYNFNIGANYLNFDVEDNYYVFNNTFSMMAEYFYGRDASKAPLVISKRCTDSTTIMECVYVDYSPLNALQGDGRNYFRSKNIVNTESYALFGELYYNVNDRVRVTLGARYTFDKKTTTPYPTQLLLGYSDIIGGFATGGSSARGLVADPDIKQDWGALTGRAVLDWRINDDVMIYGSLARGYKGGGTNPPRPGMDEAVVQYLPIEQTFEPEYVNAVEIGLKSTVLDQRLRLNLTGFYYDYEDYQVSQIVDRISLNENFNATSMGLELEAIWQPTPAFRLNANMGYLKTEIDKGEKSIDVMNRTQGNEDWVLLRPWVQVPSNCIAPKALVERILAAPVTRNSWLNPLSALCGSANRIGSFHPDFPTRSPYYNTYGFIYNPQTDAPNSGRGFDADLSENELPNAPRFTANVGAQYTWNIGQWDLSVRGDYYYQSKSYFRVYNTEYDRIKAWDSSNASIELSNKATGTSLNLYVKNIFDDAPIVDAFTNSDDTMLTTNVFTLDPRIIGFSLSKTF